MGTSNSGKTALARQIEGLLARRSTINPKDIERFKEFVFQNVYYSICALLGALNKLELEFGDKKSRQCAEIVRACEKPVVSLTTKQQIAIKTLWMDPAVKLCYEERHKYSLDVPESAFYFLENFDRFVYYDYKPTTEDVARLEIPTTNIEEYTLKAWRGRMLVKIVDASGKPAERVKLINCLFNCRAIIFVADVSEFDRKGSEKEEHIGLEESKALFHGLLQERYLDELPLFLVLNKVDILREKLRHIDIADFYPDFHGPKNDVEAACDFFVEEYLVRCKSRLFRGMPVHASALSATDVEEVRFFFTIMSAQLIPTGTIARNTRPSSFLYD